MINIEWSKEEKKLLRILRPVCTTKEIEEVFRNIGYSRSPDAIERKSRRLGIRFFHLGDPDLEGVDIDIRDVIESAIENRLMRPDLPRLRSPINKYPEKITKQEEQRAQDYIKQIIDYREELNLVKPRIVTQPYLDNGISIVVALSDIHMGRSFQDLIGDISYNTEIARQRCELYKQEIIKTISKYENTDEVVILIAGDIADGFDIFPGHTEYIETTPIYQVHKSVSIITGILFEIRETFPDIIIKVVTCRGNHGRVGSLKISNWDNVVYQELGLICDICNSRFGDRIYVSNNFNIEYNTTIVKGWKILMRHHAPAQADTPAAQKKFGNWHDIHQWDAIVYGHWHHWGVMTWQGRPVFRNGSVVGADPYAESLAVFDEPAQLIFGVTKEKIPEFISPISLSL